MKEQIKKFLSLPWFKILIILAIFIYLLIQFQSSKYYFIKDEYFILRCNRITGSCDIRRSGEDHWELLVK